MTHQSILTDPGAGPDWLGTYAHDSDLNLNLPGLPVYRLPCTCTTAGYQTAYQHNLEALIIFERPQCGL